MPATRTQFDQQLQALRQRVIEMGALSEEMLREAVRVLQAPDEAAARDVIRKDDRIDRMDIEIEMECFRIIALETPVARDLRLVGTVVKLIADLERIADYAVDIAKIGRRLVRSQTLYKPIIDIQRLADMVCALVLSAVRAFAEGDMALVQETVNGDDAVDVLFHQQRSFLISEIKRDPEIAFLGVYLCFAAKYLERAADHACNIAERVSYAETGELLRTKD
ncbi:MAG TPA: phosphate signaling complex protein PhoU [Chthonomonadales bacterium]|nr:phosphate signaling complex protein PhoU [Chthonomonadales bacterium]